MKNASDINRIIQSLKHIGDDILDYPSYNVGAAFEKTDRQINKLERKTRTIVYFSRIASVFFIPLLITSLILGHLYWKQDNHPSAAIYHTVTSAPGLITQLELPDNSKVWLNSGSTIRYPSHFDKKERNVFLTGEGYFDVESDKKNPFIVHTNNIKIKSYGTQFNVNSYMEDEIFETVLVEGKIDVIVNNKIVQLKPNELVSYKKSGGLPVISKIQVDEKIAWKDGKLIFRNSTLEDVLKVLSRRYNLDIILHRETSTDYKFRASFSNETITQILNYLKLAAPIEWSFNELEQNEDSSYTRQKIDLWLRRK